jgi:hypothetical protein
VTNTLRIAAVILGLVAVARVAPAPSTVHQTAPSVAI